VIIKENGWESGELAAIERVELENFLTYVGSIDLQFKLVKFKKEPISNLMVVSMLPNLTEKQKQALQLAVENNYYGYPKKTNVKSLAKEMDISVSTCQFHLAKAEAKINAFFD